MKGKLIKSEHHGYILEDYKGNLLATISDNDSIYKLSLKNCEAVFNGYDLDEMACVWHKNEYGFIPQLQVIKAYIAGFQKALELVEHRLSKETEWQVEIVMDICGDKVYAVPEPALDEQGCLILKRIDN